MWCLQSGRRTAAHCKWTGTGWGETSNWSSQQNRRNLLLKQRLTLQAFQGCWCTSASCVQHLLNAPPPNPKKSLVSSFWFLSLCHWRLKNKRMKYKWQLQSVFLVWLKQTTEFQISCNGLQGVRFPHSCHLRANNRATEWRERFTNCPPLPIYSSAACTCWSEGFGGKDPVRPVQRN